MEPLDIITFALVLVTLYLGYETYQMRKNQVKPIISIQTKPHNKNINYILLSIVNCGNGLAKNIKLKTDNDFPVTYNLKTHQTIPLKDLGVFSHPFNLGANQNFDFILKFLPEDYESLRTGGSLVFKISVEYEDIHNHKYSQEFIIDLEIYQHLSFVIDG
jgi:hypothetical protein